MASCSIAWGNSNAKIASSRFNGCEDPDRPQHGDVIYFKECGSKLRLLDKGVSFELLHLPKDSEH